MRFIAVMLGLALALSGCASANKALYYLACPEVGEWSALEKWPEDCAPLKARLGVE